MRTALVFCIMTLLFVFSTAGLAQEGTREFRLFGNYSHLNGAEGGGSADNIGGGLLVGSYIDDNWLLGLQGLATYDSDVEMYQAALTAQWHCPTDSGCYPYWGALFGYVYLEDNSRDGWVYGPLAGLKFEMDPDTDLFVEYQYQLYIDDVRRTLDDGGNVILVGLSWNY